MQQSCNQCERQFDVADADLALLDKCSPEIGGKKYPMPPPTMCFDCRLLRRLAFYNCRSLYRRRCSATNKEIISVFSPSKPFTVYDKDIWWNDNWDPLDYGRDVDFSRPIFPQIRELMEAVPQQSLAKLGSSTDTNSDFINDGYKLKNCYMIFDGELAESCYHGHTYYSIRDCVDFLSLHSSELCWESIHCKQCYNLRCSRFCVNCSDSWFLRDCIGCRNCFGCANLRQKQHCIFNEQKTEAEYAEFMKRFQSSKRSEVEAMRERAEAFMVRQPVKATRGEQNIDCTGDNIYQSKDCHECFDSVEARDSRYCTNVLAPGTRDSMDVHTWGDNMERCYNSALIGAQSRNIIAGYYVLVGVDSIYYSQWCTRSCRNLFGCICLRHKDSCVFNKQYPKEEYEKLVQKIIEHMMETKEWGEYYPPEISAFGYNETMAQTFFPMERDAVLKKGWQWCDEEVKVEAERTIKASQLPDDSNDVPDDVLNWAILCEVTGKPFKIIAQELEFHRTHQLPLPRRHPDQRHRDRFAFKNPYKLWKRTCAKCGGEIQTTYSLDRKETVYCEGCYLQSVY